MGKTQYDFISLNDSSNYVLRATVFPQLFVDIIHCNSCQSKPNILFIFRMNIIRFTDISCYRHACRRKI